MAQRKKAPQQRARARRGGDGDGRATGEELLSYAAQAGLGERDAVAALFLLGRLGRLNEANLELVARRHGITAAELYVLAPLLLNAPRGGLSVSEIRRFVVQTSSGVTKTIHRLERSGLIRRRPDSSDGRVRRVTLTPRGRSTGHAILLEAVAELERMLAPLSRADRRIALDGLVRLVDAAIFHAEA